MGPILALAIKDLRLLGRDRMGFFFTLVFPLVVAVFFGKVFSGGNEPVGGLEVAVVDEDDTPGSREFVERLDALPEFAVERATRAEAAESVRRGRRVAYLVLTPGFGQARGRPFAGEPPRIVLGLDPARQAEGGLLRGVLTQALAEDLSKTFADPDRLREQVRENLRTLDEATGLAPADRETLRRFLGELDRFLESEAGEAGTPGGEGFPGFVPATFESEDVVPAGDGPRSAYDVTFPQGMLWGVLSASFGFALSLVGERKAGTLFRLRTAPLSSAQILAGKALACFVAILGVSLVLLAIAVVAFGVRPASPALLGLALLATAFGFVGVMMLLSVLGRSEASVNGLGWAAMMAMAMLGGGMIPLFFMPPWLRAASVVSPVRWSILAIEGAIWRGFSLAEMLPPCAVLVAVGLAGFAIGARVFRWSED